MENDILEFKTRKRDIWNKCVYCGKFIGYIDFDNGKAINEMIIPESYYTNETWEAYHIDCKNN